MIHMGEKFDFSKSPFGIYSVVESISNLFYCNLFPCLRIRRRAAIKSRKTKKHEIKTQNTQKNRIKAFYTESNKNLPNDAISSTTDRLNRWSVLGSDLKEVSMDTVLHKFSAMSRKSFYFRM